jgi:hypothetical protein
VVRWGQVWTWVVVGVGMGVVVREQVWVLGQCE